MIGVLLLATAAAASSSSLVVALDEESFDGFVEGERATMIEFYAPWCGHCKRLAPLYEEAAERLAVDGAARLGKVDCTQQKTLCSRFEVRGYPTLKVFAGNTNEPSAYSGKRSVAAIVEALHRATAVDDESVERGEL